MRSPRQGATAGPGPGGALPPPSALLLQPPPGPDFIREPGRGGPRGSSTVVPSALTYPYSEPERLDKRPRKPSIFLPGNEKAECTLSLRLPHIRLMLPILDALAPTQFREFRPL